MYKTVSAIYAAGSLQLLEPLALPESTKVQVQIFNSETDVASAYQPVDSFRHCLGNIHHLLTQVEQHWSVDLVHQTLPRLLNNELRTLWYLCALPQRKLCAMLELSAKQLDAAQLTVEQLAALRFGLDMLEKDALTELDLKICRRKLVDVGLPPRFTLNDAVVQSYVDEL